jgi:hypothetical protein
MIAVNVLHGSKARRLVGQGVDIVGLIGIDTGVKGRRSAGRNAVSGVSAGRGHGESERDEENGGSAALTHGAHRRILP